MDYYLVGKQSFLLESLISPCFSLILPPKYYITTFYLSFLQFQKEFQAPESLYIPKTYDITSSYFYYSLYSSVSRLFFTLFLVIFESIWSKPINISFIWSKDPIPTINTPLNIFFYKSESGPPMSYREKRSFLLDMWLVPSLLVYIPDHMWYK